MLHPPALDAPGANGDSTAQQVSAVQSVIDHVRRAIRAGRLAPGAHVRERDLGESCGVSRGAIREAMMMLVAEGTLMREHRHIARVRQFTREEVWAHHQIREALEGLAAGLAAGAQTQARYHPALRDIRDRLRRHAESGDCDAYLMANYDFHALVIEMSGNPFVEAHIGLTHAAQLRMQAARFMDRDGIDVSHAEHEEIIAAILDGDGERAEAAMRAHIRGTRRTLLELPDGLFRSGEA